MKSLLIPYFELTTFDFSIKLLGGQKIAFFCFGVFSKYFNRSCWLTTGYLRIGFGNEKD